MQTILEGLFKKKTNNHLIEIFRFILAGAVSFIIDFSALFIFTEIFGIYYVLSAALSFTIGLSVNYFLCANWVFMANRLKNKYAEFTIFGIIGIGGLFLNTFFIWLLTAQLGLHYLASKIVATILVLAWNFIAKKYILFSIS